MCKHGGTPSQRDKHVTPAAICPPGVARGRFVGGQQSGLAGCKPPPLFTRRASSLLSQGRRQGEPMGRLPTTKCTYLPTYWSLRYLPQTIHTKKACFWVVLHRHSRQPKGPLQDVSTASVPQANGVGGVSGIRA